MIRECSGIVYTCLDADTVRALELSMMTIENGSRYGTAFTVSKVGPVGILSVEAKPSSSRLLELGRPRV
jgi:hypothetical protein